MTRRSRTLTLLAALACGIAALGGGPVGAAPSPSAAEQRDANGLLGLVGVDHVGLTVPDIDEAVAWFEDVLGCSAPLTSTTRPTSAGSAPISFRQSPWPSTTTGSAPGAASSG